MLCSIQYLLQILTNVVLATQWGFVENKTTHISHSTNLSDKNSINVCSVIFGIFHKSPLHYHSTCHAVRIVEKTQKILLIFLHDTNGKSYAN